MQTASSAFHSIGTGEGDVFPLLCPFDFVAFAFHEKNEIFTAAAFLHRVTDVIHQPELPALPFLRSPPFSGGHFLAPLLIFGQDTKPVGQTHIITDLPQVLQRVGVLPKLHPGFKIDGVDNEVAVDMPGVAMSGDKNLRAGPGPGSEVHGEFMCLPGRDVLCWLEGLHILVEVDAVHLSV